MLLVKSRTSRSSTEHRVQPSDKQPRTMVSSKSEYHGERYQDQNRASASVVSTDNKTYLSSGSIHPETRYSPQRPLVQRQISNTNVCLATSPPRYDTQISQQQRQLQEAKMIPSQGIDELNRTNYLRSQVDNYSNSTQKRKINNGYECIDNDVPFKKPTTVSAMSFMTPRSIENREARNPFNWDPLQPGYPVHTRSLPNPSGLPPPIYSSPKASLINSNPNLQSNSTKPAVTMKVESSPTPTMNRQPGSLKIGHVGGYTISSIPPSWNNPKDRTTISTSKLSAVRIPRPVNHAHYIRYKSSVDHPTCQRFCSNNRGHIWASRDSVTWSETKACMLYPSRIYVRL